MNDFFRKRWSKFFEFAATETGGCEKEAMEDFFGMFSILGRMIYGCTRYTVMYRTRTLVFDGDSFLKTKKVYEIKPIEKDYANYPLASQKRIEDYWPLLQTLFKKYHKTI